MRRGAPRGVSFGDDGGPPYFSPFFALFFINPGLGFSLWAQKGSGGAWGHISDMASGHFEPFGVLSDMAFTHAVRFSQSETVGRQEQTDKEHKHRQDSSHPATLTSKNKGGKRLQTQ